MRGYLVAVAACAWLLSSCAKVGVPPGGPEDQTGPLVIRHYPEADAVRVTRKLTARIVFSEPVNRASVEAALFFAPEPGNRLRYHWHGRTLDLIFLDSLVANRTYVISVGSGAKDQRGNPLGYSYTIAFSTGDQIDRGRLAGLIADETAPQSVSLFTYALTPGDSVDPAARVPEYRLQAARDGTFRFGYLAVGTYRVFAVQDRNGDGKWQPPTERIGMAPWDVTVSDSVDAWTCFKLAKQDTAPLAILSTREIDQTRFEIRLNHALDSARAWQFAASGRDTVIAVGALADTSGTDVWQVFTAQPLEPGDWIVRSADGLLVDSLAVKTRPDTSRPRVIATEPDPNLTARIVVPFQIRCSEPVVTVPAFADSVLLISSTAETLRVAVRPGENPAVELAFEPAAGYAEGRAYTLSFDGRLVADAAGNPLADTTVAFRFAYYPADSLGRVVGDIANQAGPFVVRLLRAQTRDLVADLRITGTEFEINRLVPGKYVVELIADRGAANPGGYDFGSVYPFEFAEPFMQSADTVAIRARWDYETSINWMIHP